MTHPMNNAARGPNPALSQGVPLLPKRPFLLALACYLAIPVVVIAGARLALLIDPEMARGHADYVRDYRWLELVRQGVLLAVSGLALLLWMATCYLLLRSRQRSLGWLALSAAGPFGFIVIATLASPSPAPGDRYQQFIGRLKIYARVPLEIAVFVAIWFVAAQAVQTKRELLISYQAFTTGTPVATIVAEQNASSGMYAFGEALEVFYLVPLIYLLWPLAFNLAARLCRPRRVTPELPQAATFDPNKPESR